MQKFIQIKNDIIEAIFFQYSFTSREKDIIFAIIRFTIGVNKVWAELKPVDISNATGINISHITETVEKLIKCNAIEKDGRFAKRWELRINSNTKTWQTTKKANFNQEKFNNLLHKSLKTTCQNSNKEVAQLATKKLPNQQVENLPNKQPIWEAKMENEHSKYREIQLNTSSKEIEDRKILDYWQKGNFILDDKSLRELPILTKDYGEKLVVSCIINMTERIAEGKDINYPISYLKKMLESAKQEDIKLAQKREAEAKRNEEKVRYREQCRKEAVTEEEYFKKGGCKDKMLNAYNQGLKKKRDS